MSLERYLETDDPRDLWRGRVVCDVETLGGKPRIAGTRVGVDTILEQLAAGASMDDVLASYPFLTREDVRAAIGFALDLVRRHVPVPAAGTAS